MKFASIFLFAIVAVTATNAHPAPEPFFFDIFATLTQTFGNAANSLLQTGADVFTNGVNIANNIAQTGINTASSIAQGIVGGVTGAVVESANSMKNITQVITNSISSAISTSTGDAVKQAASAFETQVKSLQSLAEQVLTKADETLATMTQTINAEGQKLKDDVNNFNNEQTSAAASSSAETQQQVDEMLFNFVEESNQKIDECTENMVAPIGTLNQQVRDSIQSSFPLIDDVVAKIKECGALNKFNLSAVTACANEIKTKAQALLPYTTQYNGFLSQLSSLASSATSSTCLATLPTELQQQKDQLAAEIKTLIDEDAAAAEAATQA